MKILTHTVHTSHESLYRFLPYEFDMGNFFGYGKWNSYERFVPDNINLTEEIGSDYDLIIAHTADAVEGWIELRDKLNIPLVAKFHTFSNVSAKAKMLEFKKERKFDIFISNSIQELADWEQEDYGMACPQPFPAEELFGWKGNINRAVFVGNSIETWDRLDNLRIIAREIPIDIHGTNLVDWADNSLRYPDLIESLKSHRVFVNAGPLMTMAPLEAMAVGCPVVAFNFPTHSHILGEYVPQANTVEELILLAKGMLSDINYARQIGLAQRKVVTGTFTTKSWIDNWALFIERAIENYGRNRTLGG
jgi:hypothetical protein